MKRRSAIGCALLALGLGVSWLGAQNQKVVVIHAGQLFDGKSDQLVSNQVIEHLYDTDLFVAENARIAKPGGLVIVSTENASSWHNIGALVLGWQAFSLTNVSGLAAGVGNPLALRRGDEGWPFPMQHHRIFSLRGLIELGTLHGLQLVRALGAGYHPLPPSVGRLDATHAHFITIAFRKPE